jgi:acyl-CoA dehydrogenase
VNSGTGDPAGSPETASEHEALAALAVDIMTGHQPASDSRQTRVSFNASLWKALADAGLTALCVPEQLGGAGAGVAEAAVLLSAAGQFAAAVPLAETDLLAGWLQAAAGWEVDGNPATAAGGDLRISGTRLTGTATRVPWARDAVRVLALARDDGGEESVVRLDPGDYQLTAGVNVAGEPRDTLIVDAVLQAGQVSPAPGGAREELRLRGALARALATCGAAERALELTVRYVSEREQFGRTLSRFQSVQQAIAIAAGEAAAARAAADAAVRIVAGQGFLTPAARLAVAVAKARSAEHGSAIARMAHQLHGAMGFTLEHQLRLSTTRIWAWRSEFGSQHSWDELVGKLAVAAGQDGLWDLITGGASEGIPPGGGPDA